LSNTLKAIGVASRASLEGIDVTLIETDGDVLIEAGPALHAPFSRDMKIFVRRAEKAAREGRDGAADIGKAGGEVTKAMVSAVENFLERENIKRKDVDVIGVGGHSILFRAPAGAEAPGLSWRIGDGATVAEETRIDVVCDFEKADIAAGGRGAPLSPTFFRALVASMADNPQCPVGILDLGDAVHVVYAPENAPPTDLLAYDAGPGVALLNEWAQFRRVTDDAPAGDISDEALRMMALHPYLRLAPPKFTDRYKFSLDHILKLPSTDGAATLYAHIADCIAQSETFLSEPPGGYIVHGRGAQNAALMAILRDRLEADIATPEDAGWRSETLNAECAAFLAVRSLKRAPLTYPKTTRAPTPLLGGVFHRAPV